MRTKEGAPAGQAKSPNSPNRTTEHTTTARAFTHGSNHRRWNRKPRTVTVLVSDVIVWAVFTVLTIAVLLACIALLWAVAP